jgi:hypothetical protein
VISERGFVTTRQGIDALCEQLHAEAVRRGLGQAASTLVIGDGAVWIWRLAFYQAVQHLASVGRALFGEDKEKYRAWLKLLIKQLKNQSAIKVIRQLEEALAQVADATMAPGRDQRSELFPGTSRAHGLPGGAPGG